MCHKSYLGSHAARPANFGTSRLGLTQPDGNPIPVVSIIRPVIRANAISAPTVNFKVWALRRIAKDLE